MWIDAICIDQSDNDDKSLQVHRMGDIYRLAARVVAWLGPEGDDSSRGMDRMQFLGSQVTLNRTGELIAANNCADPTVADRYVKLPFTEQDLRSVYHLLCRPWFDRLWVRQEIYLANSKSIVKCGPHEVPWTTFHLTI